MSMELEFSSLHSAATSTTAQAKMTNRYMYYFLLSICL